MHIKIKMASSDIDALMIGASLIYDLKLEDIIIEINHDTDYLKEENSGIAIANTDGYSKLSESEASESNKAR